MLTSSTQLSSKVFPQELLCLITVIASELIFEGVKCKNLTQKGQARPPVVRKKFSKLFCCPGNYGPWACRVAGIN